MSNNKIIEQLKRWLEDNCNPYTISWMSERSAGNSSDCFDDGADSQRSWDAYEIGQILGVDLEEPKDPDEEC